MGDVQLDEPVCAFYRRALDILQTAGVPVQVGGAFALLHYTGISRHTKDFDIFLRKEDVARALDILSEAGFRTELVSGAWLAKAHDGDNFVDLIFGSGNGLATVDHWWFERAEEGTVLGLATTLCPAEEVIFTKAFIMERDRFDGADIAHIVRARHDRLDWSHLLLRFGVHWRVLLVHLVLFGFVYPGERHLLPNWVMQDLMQRLADESASEPLFEKLCQGPLLAKSQYVIDTEQWGYEDPRFPPWGEMTLEEAGW
jgi:hypothetical protein